MADVAQELSAGSKTVYDHYSNWNRRGVWEAALDELNALHREKTIRPRRRATR